MANNSGRKRRFGATRQLPSGRWQIRYPDPVTKQLRPGEKTFATKTDAEVALSVIEADMVRGKWSDPDSGKITLTEYSDTWIKERQLAATSRDRNEGVLRLHILPKLGASGLNEISTPRIRSWRAGLLESGVGAPTVVKAYQILRAIMNTAVDDGLILRNPCRIKGAGNSQTPERPVLTVAEVFQVADAIDVRFRMLVLLAAFTGLRFGELAALQRRDLDLEKRTVRVQRAQAETKSSGLDVKAPKSAAGVRTVAFPASLVPALEQHLKDYSQPGRTGLVFIGPRKGSLRRSNFRDTWLAALKEAGIKGVHFHDLRHTGNTLAASSGASTRELMQRMGHSSVRAALIYQHLTGGRDHVIADYVDQLIKKDRKGNRKQTAQPPNEGQPGRKEEEPPDKIDSSGT